MTRHLLVTNDFPPKVGGIQSYLWELWRRLDPESFVVLTASSHPDAQAFDSAQAARGVRIVRPRPHHHHQEDRGASQRRADGLRLRVSGPSGIDTHPSILP